MMKEIKFAADTSAYYEDFQRSDQGVPLTDAGARLVRRPIVIPRRNAASRLIHFRHVLFLLQPGQQTRGLKVPAG